MFDIKHVRGLINETWPTCFVAELTMLIIPAACFTCKYVIKPVLRARVWACTSNGSRPHGRANSIQCSLGI